MAKVIDWFRCNKCWIQMRTANTEFLLTECLHLFCQRCIEKAGDNCLCCQALGVRTRLLNQSLSSELSILFVPNSQQSTRIDAAIKFQEEQHLCLERRYEELDRKYSVCKKAYMDLLLHIKQINEENEKYKDLFQNLPSFFHQVLRSEKVSRKFDPPLPGNFFQVVTSNQRYPSSAGKNPKLSELQVVPKRAGGSSNFRFF